MAPIYDFNEFEILAFFLVVMRMSAFVVSWPVFGAPTVPNTLKILFALLMSMLIFPIVDYSALNQDLLSTQIIVLALREVFIGLIFGYLAKFFFFGIRIAGEIISVTIGLSSSQLFNPAFGGQVTSVEQFKIVVASLFFLAINGHHLLVGGLIDSFRVIPLSGELLNLDHFQSIGIFMQEIMEIGFSLSAPVLISIFFVNVGMAVIGRTVPQINVLITSLPVNILVGLFVMTISVPLLIWQMEGLMELTTSRLFAFVKEL
ncbi:MAG: flagellar biosynthetic protein FliR [Pseudomonadota bacterium]